MSRRSQEGLQLDVGWIQLEPSYRELAEMPLDAATLPLFIARWSDLSTRVEESYARLYAATTCDTGDVDVEARYQAFLDTVYPAVLEADQVLKERLLQSGLQPEGMNEPLRRMRAEAELFRPANVPLLIQEEKLNTQYHKVMGSQTVQWEGEEIPVAQLQTAYQSTDRSIRERAWRLGAQRLLDDRESINTLWREMLELRGRIATNSGFDNYRAYRWQQLRRLDYTPDDMLSFHRAIAEVVVPAVARRFETRREQLGVEILRPWDLNVDTWGGEPLRPYTLPSELPEKTSNIFHRLDPELGERFDVMRREGLLDLESRKNKAPGGYCIGFPLSHRPFIFMNAVDVHRDVETLLHEGGHAFHFFATDVLPVYQQRQAPMEFAEVASTAMEYLGAPFLVEHEGGFYSERDTARARIEHLDRTLLAWPRLATIDAFQHWVYLHPDQSADPDACDSHWEELWKAAIPVVDWSGLEAELRNMWRSILHIFVVPFYIVEYCLAELGAVQVWRASLGDRATALRRYKDALALGGTLPLPGLYAAAGARFAFDAATLRDAVDLIEETITSLESTLGEG